MAVESMRELYRHLLAEAYDAERHSLMLLDQLETQVSAQDARDRVRDYRAATARQIEMLERAMELLGGACPAVRAAAMQGLLEQYRAFGQAGAPGQVLETYGIITLGRAAELSAVAYRGLSAVAGTCAQADARRLFERALAEEETAAAWCTATVPVLAAAATLQRGPAVVA
jgi:ferritin-like metal-binding protein YciE